MDKRFPVVAGLVLMAIGVTALMCNGMVLLSGMNVARWGPWRLWPMIILAVGLAFVLPPLAMPTRRGLGVLFIPGVPILTTGSVLLFTSVFDVWGAWSWLWPVEVMGVAVGFLFAALFTRVAWLLVPAIIVGLNGLAFQFCAITGLWELWSVLWTIEPMSVGLALGVIGVVKRWLGLFLAGAIMCGFATMGFFGTPFLLLASHVVPAWWLFRLWGPALLLLVGFLLLLSGTLKRAPVGSPVGD